MGKRFLIFWLMTCMMATAAVAGRRFTVVIDAGHGGHDTGAMGATYKEKNLALRYALAFGNIIERNCPDVKVIYTRKSDKFLELRERADIANRNKADLFISIHLNAVSGGRIVHGYQTWTLGKGARTGDKGIKENLEVAKRENSVIYLEKDYKTAYKGFDPNSAESDIMFEFMADKNREKSTELAKYLQNSIPAATGRVNGGVHQNNLAVLRLTSMPGCLMELGFISTPDEESFIASDAALLAYTTGFYNAFVQYKNKYDTQITVPYKTLPVQAPDVPAIVPDEYKPESKQQEAPKQRVSRQQDIEKPDSNKTKEQDAVTEPQNEKDVAADNLTVFKVQILASSRKLRPDDQHLKGHKDVDYYEEDGYFKYTCGASTDYNEINKLRVQLTADFPGSFVIAFKNGKKVNAREAVNEFLQHKNK